MEYHIVYTRTAVKDIKKLDKVSRKKLKAKIELYLQDPLHYARKLVNSLIGEYRWRIGKVRVVFDVDQKKKTVVVLRVRHRREVYA